MDKREERGRRVILEARRVRLCVLGGIALLALCAAGLLYALLPRQVQTEEPLYAYTLTAGADYRVHLLPNQLYPGGWLEAGGVYASALSDLVELTFRVTAQGDAPAKITGTYSIQAVLEGSQSSGEGKKTVYRKAYPLAKGELFKSSDSEAKAERVLRVALSDYRQQAAAADADLGLSVGREFSLELSGTVEIGTAHGVRQEAFSHIISLPLPKEAALFEITNPEPTEKSGAITETRETALPVKAGLLPLCILIGAAGAALLLFARRFTRGPTEQERERAARAQLKRKYGSRMVSLTEPPHWGARARVGVSDMEGLLTMAEELRLPACYCADPGGLPREGRCFITAPDCVYEYRLTPPPEDTTLVAGPSAEGGS